MNKKQTIYLVLFTFFSVNLHALTVGLEMTFPWSSLLFLCEAGDFSKIKSASEPNWNAYWRWKNFGTIVLTTRYLPQCDGYYATQSDSNGNIVDIVLQRAVSLKQYGFFSNISGPYANGLLYYSDAARCYNNYSYGSIKGPNAEKRGAQKTEWESTNFNYRVAVMLNTKEGENVNKPSQWLKHNGFFTNGTTLNASNFKPVSGETINFYFAQTGVDVYLPLHMVSPGDRLTCGEPNYLNFGPFPNNYNTAESDILPWSHGYIAKHLPLEKLKTTKF